MKSFSISAAMLACSFLAACGTPAEKAESPALAEAKPASQEEALFLRKCGICHSKGGTGTMMLERRLGAENALLAERTDLTPEYIAAVVRHGLNSMPPITRVELTDAQLRDVSFYLTGQRLTDEVAEKPGDTAKDKQP
ncbi:c-type cytochrome [Altericroceibacterium endophyticum]|uniref:Cytochrome c domain-containing protein n=1 Tax=Altericroceibacterium endophyticum TaxID=1808508 RepID=A0A6I4T796_9SPHN|nr:cytochrome c [Altericroceibacterium endophyticum]MXO66826.1 hypothetical protein [Altericroceibacterium endophyticum]